VLKNAEKFFRTFFKSYICITMRKMKYILLLVCLVGCFSACKKDAAFEDFDIEGQFKKDTTAIRAFAVAKQLDVKKDPTYNFFYQIIDPGTGTAEVNGLSQIKVTYSGSLLDGTVFAPKTSPAEYFPLSGMITGWQAGIPLIKKGGKIRLLLPSFYGYGNQGNATIPSNSVLDFTVELLDVK
jgi:FKBP-type peptidyl-prolyl cis-trans isomerase FkpA